MSLLLLQGAQVTSRPAGAPPQASQITIFDQIQDPAERRAFRQVWDAAEPSAQRDLALRFVAEYPASVLLREAYELAARAFVSLGDLAAGLEWTRRSLRLIPENPFLLVMAGDIAIAQRDLPFAATSARDALRYLATADTAAPFTREQWPQARDRLRGAAHRVLGRVAAIQGQYPEAERELLQALSFNAADTDAAYVLAVARVAAHRPDEAAPLFALVTTRGGPLAGRAREALRSHYDRLPAGGRPGFEAYVASLKWTPPPPPRPSQGLVAGRYAGSASCEPCHRVEVDRWQQTGMAKMLRPYRAQNVFGDFSGQIVLGKVRPLIENGRHHIEIRSSDRAPWVRYPVDYTIGSKWQQAYVTTLADGRMLVFPVQYSRLQSAWINYWAAVDGPGSTRSDIGRFAEAPEEAVYQSTCAPCHTSQLQYPPGSTRAAQARFLEGGINCEMCHGPSLGHVESMAGVSTSPDAGRPFSFRRLPAAESVAICAQCHAQSAVHDVSADGAANFSRAAPFYRAYATHLPSAFSRSAFYLDGRYRATTFIVESFVRSACFRTGGATCASCHTPHPADAAANPTSLKFPADADAMCLQCHQALGDRPERHTRHAPGTEASRCVSCHMPRIMDALLFPARSHEIDDVPDAEMAARFGVEGSPNACLACHRDRDTSWLAARMVERGAGHAK